jgi:hypothetical protein
VRPLVDSVPQRPGGSPLPGSGMNYTGPSSCRKKNLPGRGLTKVKNHYSKGFGRNAVKTSFHFRRFSNEIHEPLYNYAQIPLSTANNVKIARPTSIKLYRPAVNTHKLISTHLLFIPDDILSRVTPLHLAISAIGICARVSILVVLFRFGDYEEDVLWFVRDNGRCHISMFRPGSSRVPTVRVSPCGGENG